MRVRSFRNTVLFFFYFAAAKILQSRGKAKGGSFSWWGDWADGRRLSLCPTKRLFTSADDGE